MGISRRVRRAAGVLLGLSVVLSVAVAPETPAGGLLLHVAPQLAEFWLTVVVLVSAVLVVWWLWRRPGADLGRTMRRGTQLVLHLWPVVTLTAAYPIASHGMGGHVVGGIGLTTFLLAAALTLPWLLQGICMPLYRELGELVHSGDQDALRRGFCAALPGSVLLAVPFIGLSAIPLSVLLGWGASAVGAFCLLLLLDVLFAQSLVLANLTRSRADWVAGWSAYAAAVLLLPTWWWLPPVAGVLTQIPPVLRYAAVRPSRVRLWPVLPDIGVGLFLGTMMWGDKLIYFYRTAGDIPVIVLFFASLPAVVAYNFYFVCRSPGFDSSVRRLHHALESESLRSLRNYSEDVYQTAVRSIGDTAFIGAVLVGIVAISLWSLASPEHASLVGAVAATSWLSAVVSIACYKLQYVQNHRSTVAIGAIHLIVMIALFASPLADSAAYLGIAGAELACLLLALVLFRRAWRTPEHTLFWSRALAW